MSKTTFSNNEFKLFKIVINKVCSEHDIDTKDWDEEKWMVVFEETGDLTDTYLVDTNDVEGWMDWSLFEIAEYNALDVLKFVGILPPNGDENWIDYTTTDNKNYQRYKQ